MSEEKFVGGDEDAEAIMRLLDPSVTRMDDTGTSFVVGVATGTALNADEFFATCERDEKGRCVPAGTAGFAKPAEQEAAVELARSKIKGAPVPTAEKVAKMRAQLELARQGLIRAGGDARGNSADRKARARNLFKEFGGEERGYVVCPWTGLKMHWTDDKTENPKGYPKFEQGKIFTAHQGGGYQLPNLIPESFAANRSRNDKPMRKENLA